jgi:hypothetical protein
MKRLFLIVLSVFCLSAMFVSCNKADVATDYVIDSLIITSDVEDVDVSKLNKNTVARFNNIRKIGLLIDESVYIRCNVQ